MNDNSDVSVVSGNVTADREYVIREITDTEKDILIGQIHEYRCIDGYIGELVR